VRQSPTEDTTAPTGSGALSNGSEATITPATHPLECVETNLLGAVGLANGGGLAAHSCRLESWIEPEEWLQNRGFAKPRWRCVARYRGTVLFWGSTAREVRVGALHTPWLVENAGESHTGSEYSSAAHTATNTTLCHTPAAYTRSCCDGASRASASSSSCTYLRPNVRASPNVWFSCWSGWGSSLGDAKSSLGDAESSLGDAKSSLGDAESSLGDAKTLLGDAKSSH
jgi:hypothetical protein